MKSLNKTETFLIPIVFFFSLKAILLTFMLVGKEEETENMTAGCLVFFCLFFSLLLSYCSVW